MSMILYKDCHIHCRELAMTNKGMTLFAGICFNLQRGEEINHGDDRAH